jgi:hypothetical protein
VAFDEVFAKSSESFWRPDKPVERFRKDAIFEDGQPGGANAGVGIVGGFEVDAGDPHGLGCCPLNWRNDAPVSVVDQRKGMSPNVVPGPVSTEEFHSTICKRVC